MQRFSVRLFHRFVLIMKHGGLESGSRIISDRALLSLGFMGLTTFRWGKEEVLQDPTESCCITGCRRLYKASSKREKREFEGTFKAITWQSKLTSSQATANHCPWRSQATPWNDRKVSTSWPSYRRLYTGKSTWRSWCKSKDSNSTWNWLAVRVELGERVHHQASPNSTCEHWQCAQRLGDRICPWWSNRWCGIRYSLTCTLWTWLTFSW